MKILVAEDDLVTRRMLQAYREKWGYEVVTMADGQQAWQILQQEHAPRLAILDWMMPELDGTSICCEVRRLNLQPYVYLDSSDRKGMYGGCHYRARSGRGRISGQAIRSLRVEGASALRSQNRRTTGSLDSGARNAS